jgi:hypothetical protein
LFRDAALLRQLSDQLGGCVVFDVEGHKRLRIFDYGNWISDRSWSIRHGFIRPAGPRDPVLRAT